jgi:hypothetical protein
MSVKKHAHYELTICCGYNNTFLLAVCIFSPLMMSSTGDLVISDADADKFFGGLKRALHFDGGDFKTKSFNNGAPNKFLFRVGQKFKTTVI